MDDDERACPCYSLKGSRVQILARIGALDRAYATERANMVATVASTFRIALCSRSPHRSTRSSRSVGWTRKQIHWR
jgi:hypothetical protein